MKFINDYPYTNMTAQNIDWLIKAVVDLIHEGKTDEEIKNAPGISEAYGAFCNAYPYTNMTMQNIDWLISSVRELYDKEATLEETVTKIEAQMQTLQADVDNIVDKFGDKVDKLNVKNNVYVTDGSTPPKTTGIQYMESPLEGTIPIRDGIGSLQVPTAQDATQAVNKGQMDTALDGKVDKATAPSKIYGTGSNGEQSLYTASATVNAPWSVPLRYGTGTLIAADATKDNELTTKKQVDTALNGKVNKTTQSVRIYGTDRDGNQYLYKQNMDADPFTIPSRNGNGAIVAANPTQNNELTTQEYVDNAIATAPTGGWTTVLDKTWTEDETNNVIYLDIPAEYQKAMSELRMTYYNNTPQAGAVYSNQAVNIGLNDGEKNIAFMYTGNILPTKDTKEVTVNFQSVYNNSVTLYNSGSSDLYSNCYGIFLYKDSNGNAVQPIPTDPNALLNTSKIIGIAEGNQETAEYVLNTCLPNRSHHYILRSTPTTVNYTSNDYYNDQLPECVISQVLTSTDETNLPVGSFICVQRQDLKFALTISISFTSTTSVSYKNVITRQASIVGESLQVIAGAESNQHFMTSFDDVSMNGNPLPASWAYYSYLKNGYPTKVYVFPKPSTSNGVTANKIYAGSRLVLQARY